jgi:hypothetical protein
MTRSNKQMLQDILDKMDKKFEKIEQRIDDRFETIDKKFEIIDQRLKKLDNDMTNVQGFIKRDADISELEINDTVQTHLKKVFQGYEIIDYSKLLKTIRNPETRELVTDFDGLLLLQSKNEKQFPDAKRLFVIIEAKHHITLEKVQKKLEDEEAKRIAEEEKVQW